MASTAEYRDHTTILGDHASRYICTLVTISVSLTISVMILGGYISEFIWLSGMAISVSTQLFSDRHQ
jgi:hypothetical protein